MELLYRFEETGEACPEGKADCLCDVTPLPGGVPIRQVPYASRFPAHLDSPAISFIVWASTALGIFEASMGVNEAELNEALAMWEGHADPTNKSHHAAQKVSAASRCLRAGLTIEQTGRWLSVEPWAILDLFWPRHKHQLVLEMEKMIRGGATAKEVADALGVEAQWASNLARRWNVAMPHSGIRYGPADREKARDLVKSGMSRRAAGRTLGISESRVSSWCTDLPLQQRGRRKGSK